MGFGAQINVVLFDKPNEDMNGGSSAISGSSGAVQGTSQAQFMFAHTKEISGPVGQTESPSRRWADLCLGDRDRDSIWDKEL